MKDEICEMAIHYKDGYARFIRGTDLDTFEAIVDALKFLDRANKAMKARAEKDEDEN